MTTSAGEKLFIPLNFEFGPRPISVSMVKATTKGAIRLMSTEFITGVENAHVIAKVHNYTLYLDMTITKDTGHIYPLCESEYFGILSGFCQFFDCH